MFIKYLIPQNGEAEGFLLVKQGYETYNADPDPPLDEPFLFRLLFLKGKNIRNCILGRWPRRWAKPQPWPRCWAKASKGNT